MELVSRRIARNEAYTISKLYNDGVYLCDVLEDRDRGLDGNMSLNEILTKKVKANTAIPVGRYEIKLTMSPRFKRVLPLLMNVKGFEGVRIHPGNKPEDTEGCLLVGFNKVKGQLVDSRKAFDTLYRMLADEVKRGKRIFIEIR